jgi:hypothetical protein
MLEGKQKEEFRNYLNCKTFRELDLDNQDSRGCVCCQGSCALRKVNNTFIGTVLWLSMFHPRRYTLKCFACGIYAMRTEEDFKTTMNRLAHEGGDADT